MELKIENLCKSYRKKQALKNINITLTEGTYGLLGENGAGKSTLMRILTTCDFQSSGKILFNGEEIVKLGEKYRDVIGYMPQEYNVYPSFTAYDFLDYMGALKGIPKEKLEKKIQKILEFVNLAHVKNKKVNTFSGGMKRRIGIAQAILNDPKILILDEPTAGLDPKERIRFSNIISAMSKDKIDVLVEKVRVKVWEVLVNQNEFKNLSLERQVIRRKQEGDKIRVRFVGDIYEGIENKSLEPSLEDYYMSVCI